MYDNKSCAKFVQAKACDATIIGILRQKIWNTTYRGIYPDEAIDDFDFRLHLERDQKKILDPSFHVFLIRKDNNDIGYFIYQIHDTEVWLNSLYVLKEYQHNGIGKQAFSILSDYCKNNSISIISCCCNPNNKNAIAFYMHMGGVIIKTDDGHQNKQEDEVIFQFRTHSSQEKGDRRA